MRALVRSPQAPEILCAPGNPGIAADARLLAIKATDIDALVAAAREEAVGLVVVGPEAPLVAGLVDALTAAGIPAFGPSAAAAEIEGSKAYAKEVMEAAGVPTGTWASVDTVQAGLAAITSYPAVLKYDGLAAGKGVVIAPNEATAHMALEDFLIDHRFGTGQVVVEEHLEGEELSLLALCDGLRAIPLAPAQDYKRILDGDLGPNTGGMGSYSPVTGIDDARTQEISRLVHQPIVDELARRGTPFHGVLYAGLMLTADGPKVIEYNARFGDPETQAVLPRLRSDLLELMLQATRPGGLEGAQPQWTDAWAVTVVLAAAGYPGSPASGDVIGGLDDAGLSALHVTHAGTAARDDGAIVTAGGRVLNITALGDDPAAARDAAYAGAERIFFDGCQLRRDIAQRAVDRHED